jgi:uncharacterized protein DUF5335
MPVTKAISPDQLGVYFAEFTRRFLRDGSPEAADVEVLEPDLGSQIAIQGARLLGITYDPRSQTLELELDVGDHRIFDLSDVWTLEEQDGFLSSVAVAHQDGSREVVSIKRVGIRRLSS